MTEEQKETGSTRLIEANHEVLKAWRRYYKEKKLLQKPQWSPLDEEMWYKASQAYKYLLLHDSSFMPYKRISPKREKFRLKDGEIEYYEYGKTNLLCSELS